MKLLFEGLNALCDKNGVPNFEDEVREYLKARAEECGCEAFADASGNLLAFKKGKASPKRPVLVMAYMDEPGFMVKGITSDGFVRITAIDDCIDVRTVLGKKLWIGRKRVPGIISLKAIHLTPKASRSSMPDMDSLNVDIGAKSREDALKLVCPGDVAVPAYPLVEMGDCFRGKGLESRAALAVALRLMQDSTAFDTWFAFTKKSLISPYFGGTLAARRIDPGFSILINCCTADDMPNVPEDKQTSGLRKGAAIALKAYGTIYDRSVIRALTAWAEERKIPWQYVNSERIRDAGQSLTSGASGGKAVSLSVPVRYRSCVEQVVCRSDIEAVYEMAVRVLSSAGEIQ